MTIRDDFDKACSDYAIIELKAGRILDVPLFAAKWMAERCALELTKVSPKPFVQFEDFDDQAYLASLVKRLRQLAKELQ